MFCLGIYMKILSWDVGIKNLAFCLIEVIDGKTTINEWGIINLLDDVAKDCHGFIDSKNDNSKCSKKCTHYYQNGGSTHYFCGLHKNQYRKLHKEVLELIPFKTTEPCQKYKNSGKQCSKKGSFKIKSHDKTETICTYHTNLLQKKDKLNSIKKLVSTNANRAPIRPILKKLVLQMNKNTHFLTADYVLIENQPSMKNPKMKSVASTLYSWFLINGVCNNENKSNVKEIFYLCPSNKLKINDEDIQKEINKLKKTQQYAYTKKMAIAKTLQLLKTNEKWYDYLNGHGKKDDLCDSYLQGLYFLSNLKKYVK
jgi:hypothetical protein